MGDGAHHRRAGLRSPGGTGVTASTRRPLRALIGATCVLGLLTACGGNPRETAKAPPAGEQQPPKGEVPPGQTPPLIKPGLLWVQELLNFHQLAPTIAADLMILVKPPDGDSILFEISLWC